MAKKPSKKKTEVKKAPAKKAPAKKAEKKAPAKKASKEVTVKTVVHNKAESIRAKEINPATGSRFALGSSGQVALEIIVANAGKKTDKEVREILKAHRKENDAKNTCNLDAGYFSFVVASHAEHFEVLTDGSYKVVKPFEVDEKALAEAKNKKASSKASKDKKKPAKSSEKKPAKSSSKKPPKPSKSKPKKTTAKK